MIYGFSGLNNKFNKKSKSSSDLIKLLGNAITTARVVDIVLSSDHPKFDEVGGYNGIGTIFINPIDPPLPDGSTFPEVRPLFSNIKNYPLINELVIILSLPSSEIQVNNDSKVLYYINLINLWNHPHHNALPNVFNNEVLPDSQKKDYIQTEAGSVRRVTDNSTEITLGKTFKEKSNLHPLLPFEGDVIFEGRWGNSFRLGSTVKSNANNWSTTGNNGDPISIFRNGQSIDANDEGWVNIVEDINKDISSLYLTSTQTIPLTPSSNKYNSYDTAPISINKFDKSQVIITSGRLVFNSKDDHILLSSKKSINLNSIDSVNLDTKNTIINSKKIYLGDKKATENVILGKTFLNDFNILLNDLKLLASTLQSLTSLPSGTPFVSLVAPSLALTSQIEKMKNSMNSYKSDISFTK